MDEEKTKSNVFANFLQNSGLYDKIEIIEDNSMDLYNLIAGNVRLNIFCKECGENRVFTMRPIKYQSDSGAKKSLGEELLGDWKLQWSCKIVPGAAQSPWQWSRSATQKATRLMIFSFECAMDSAHKIDFIVQSEKNTLKKIGQFPSVADLTFPELNQYKKVLSKEDMRAMRRAIGLHAQGIGIGSYVYLRRIIEHLINDAKNMAVGEGAITEDQYQSEKVRDRIQLLKNYLPNMLTTNSTIYGIISKGIHELSEDDCITYFPVLQECIFMILEEWDQAKRKAAAEKRISDSLSKIASKVK
jgi:hypothetical protein